MCGKMVRRQYADAVLSNARVLEEKVDLGRPRPENQSVAIKDGKILYVGDAEDLGPFKGPQTRDIDCQGMALVPGFNDAHCHVMALASSLRGVDCRPDKAKSISQILEVISRRATQVSPGGWIRAFGYDEFYLAEKRHPTRWDLDRAAPFHPVRLDHRTGHASVLNSLALKLLNISGDTPDPADGVIERDEASGEPTGLAFEMGNYIRKATEANRDEAALSEGVRRTNELLLSKGVTSVQDASPGNDLQRWQAFCKLKEAGELAPRVTLMAGASHLQSFLDAGLGPGSGDENVRLGAIKVMLSLTTGGLQPDPEELEAMALGAHKGGFQLAYPRR